MKGNAPSRAKTTGQVFTPDDIVCMMLDYCGYSGVDILRRHIIDNSCGEGAFLCLAVARYCKVFLLYNTNTKELRKELECYIHGIEIDKEAYNACLHNLDATAADFSITEVHWDVLNADAMEVESYNARMDFVVGNPPYVRVHNLSDRYAAVKSFQFADGGMTDLYLVFFELGLRMLSPDGKLCYITPSSWLTSIAGLNLRSYIFRHRNLLGIIDFGHYQPFLASTYTIITLMDKRGGHNSLDYSVYDEALHNKKSICTLALRDICINNVFYIALQENLAELRAVLTTPCTHYVKVKNGFATLCDEIFIGNLPFREHVIPIIKASTGKSAECFFPYDNTGRPLPKEQIFSVKAVAQYLYTNKETLLKEKTEAQKPTWYLFGRTQAIKDVYVPKIAVSTLVKDIASLKINYAPPGTGVYSGLYILSRMPINEIRPIVASNDFLDYVKSLKKYKSGGYYTFNARDLETYLNYKLSEKYGKLEKSDKRQPTVFESYIDFV